MLKANLLLLLLALLLCPLASADVIYDQAGGTLKGLVVEEHKDRIVVSTEAGEQTVLRSQIEEVFYADPERNYLYLGSQALDEGEYQMARGFFQKALQINANLSEAADALARTDDLQKKLEYEPPDRDPMKALDKQWGIRIAEEGSLPIVVKLGSGLPAHRSGLALRDGLVAAWGGSLAFLPAEEAAEALLGPPGTPLKLTLQRQVRLPGQGAEAEPKLAMERLGLTVAEAAGFLKAGDRIVFINGKSTRYLPLSNARRMLQRAKGKGADLVIHRDLLVTRE